MYSGFRKLLVPIFVCVIIITGCAPEISESGNTQIRPLEWWMSQMPMSNDTSFDYTLSSPTYPEGKGPSVTIDGGHNNFHVTTGLIKPLADLLLADGYTVNFSDQKFTDSALQKTDILVVMSAMSSDFREGPPFESAFNRIELDALKKWVSDGGSLLVFSEHFPFDKAVNPLLKVFVIETSIGVTVDDMNNDGEYGQIVFEESRLNSSHSVIAGKRDVDKLVSWGGSALTGSRYSNILMLADTARNEERSWNGTLTPPIGHGDSQGLVGQFGKGKIAAFGDSNGFVAMVFNDDEGKKSKVGMNQLSFDWKNFVLNTFDWLSLPEKPIESNQVTSTLQPSTP